MEGAVHQLLPLLAARVRAVVAVGPGGTGQVDVARSRDVHHQCVCALVVVDGELCDACRPEARAHLGEDVVVPVDVLLQLARSGLGDERVAAHVEVSKEGAGEGAKRGSGSGSRKWDVGKQATKW